MAHEGRLSGQLIVKTHCSVDQQSLGPTCDEDVPCCCH